MATNRYFDTLRGPTDEERALEQQFFTPNQIVEEQFAKNLPPLLIENPASQQAALSAGFVQQSPNEFVEPSRALAEYGISRLQAQQELAKQQRDSIKNNFLFKVGDTLADTGRFFLSPLFWLGGMDTTQYDPSARVDSGYRTKFEEAEQTQMALLQKLYNARDARMNQAYQIQKDRYEMSLPTGTKMKELYDFAAQTNQLPLFNTRTPEAIESLTNQMMVNNGDAFLVGNNRVMKKPLYEQMTSIGDKFATKASVITEAFSGYKSLMESLSGVRSGFSDIAAVFSFMKSLDPRSVVREGEFQMAASATGIFQKIMNIDEQLTKALILPEDAVPILEELATRLIGHWEDSYASLRDNYARKIEFISSSPEEDINVFLGDPVVLPDFSDKEPNFPPVSTIPPMIRRPDLNSPTQSQSTPTGAFNFQKMTDLQLNDFILSQEELMRGKQ